MLLLAVALQMLALDAPVKVSVTQVSLNAMSDACRTPRKWLKHLGGEEVRFRPSSKAPYEKVDCLLKRLRAGLVPMKLGFVGNEQIPEEN